LAGAKPPPVPLAQTRVPIAPAVRQRVWHEHLAAARRAPAAPGPLRLLSAQAHLGARLSVELVAAWVALVLALAGGAWRALGRSGSAGLVALAAWLALGTMLFSLQSAMRPRYLEAFDPAVAACLGAGVVLAARTCSGHVAAAAMVTLLVAPAAVSVAAIAGHAQDSGTPGALPAARLARLSAFLRAREGGAHYEVASVAVAKAGALIARDGRPVLLLTSAYGRPLVSTGQLADAVASGQVRYALVGDSCTSASPDRWDGCSAAAAWIRAHGVDVSSAAGQPHRGLVYYLPRASS
jgi:hypothetical protein